MPHKDPEKRKAYNKAWYEANKEKIKARIKAWYEANKEKRKAYSKAWCEANKDKVSAQKKAYYEANKDKVSAQKKAYYEANKDKIKAYREANKDKIKAYDKAYRKSNPERRKAINKKYYEANSAYYIERARFREKLLNKLQRPKWYDPKLVNKIYNECHKLNKIAGFIKYHVDHIVPLQGKNVSGLHVQGNLQIILASVNLSKSNKFEVDTT
tara:strand:- start:43 stop:678 length:636 start_codon:yes stop_codon:yes gene_type:complete